MQGNVGPLIPTKQVGNCTAPWDRLRNLLAERAADTSSGPSPESARRESTLPSVRADRIRLEESQETRQPAEGSAAPVVRSPADVLRLVVAAGVVVLLLVVEWLFGDSLVQFTSDLLRGLDADTVDYDHRERDVRIESQPDFALVLTKQLRDAWSVRRQAAGYTCCQEPTLTDPTPLFSSRIDLILVHGAKPLGVRRVGTRPYATTPPLWASDHAGVVAEVRLAKKRFS